jgi:hypothetical protein
MLGKPKPARWLFASVIALSACAPAPEVATQALKLQQLPACAFAAATGLTVQALGDFPTRSAQLDPGRDALSLDSFPLDTHELRIEARFAHAPGKPTATGLLTLLPPLSARSVLLLPQGTPCVLGDPLAVALPGAAVVALPDGAVLIAGGQGTDGIALSSVLRLPAGAQLVEQVADGMLLRRAYATATAAGELVMIAGGAADDRGSAQDTYELFDSLSGQFVAARSRKLLSGPRMQHAAARLPDGRVLLVGGRAQPFGPALESAELIDVATGERLAITGRRALRDGRVAPQLLVLDSGDVLVVGGYDATGAAVTSVERFDPRARSFTRLALQLSNHAEVLASPLPGGRFAWFGCDAGKAPGCSLTLQLPSVGDFTSLALPLDFAARAPGGLSELQLLTLPDGRLLVTGREPSASVAHRAFVIDPSTAELSQRDATRVPSVLLRASDGTLVELDAFGASLRREESVSRYDSPSQDLLAAGGRWLALDTPSHWQRSSQGLRALSESARIDLVALRFVDVRAELDVDGVASVVWSAEPGTALADTTVTLDHGAVSAAGCKATLPTGQPLTLEHHGTQLQLGSSAGATLCTLRVAAGPIRLAFTANNTTLLKSLKVTRL